MDTRVDHTSPLQIKELRFGEIFEARMLNYSNGGIYFESNGVFKKGTKIYICIKNSPYKHSSGVLKYLHGEVVWRKKLKRSSSIYGYGIQLVSGISKQAFEHSDPKEKDLRRHSRKPFFRNIRFSTYKGTHEGRTKNFSASGVFIASREKLEVGHSIKLSLPLKGKPTDVTGKIVWLNEDGFGLKFKKIK